MDLWVAIIGLVGIVLGYFLRPLGELSAEVLRDRRLKAQRRDDLQYQTLIELGASLETWRVARQTVGPAAHVLQPQERVRVLTFRVRDDALREALEALLVAPGSTEWDAAHGEAVRLLGAVVRSL